MVTYAELIAFVIMIIEIIRLVVMLIDRYDKKK